MIPYGRQSIDEDDIRAVVDVLRSDWLTTGPMVDRFEEAVRSFTGAACAVAVSNGTAALHAAYAAAGVRAGDEVIVPPMTFAATANAALYLGAKPVFADVQPDDLLIDPAKAEKLITDRTKAIVAVDYAGQPCDYEGLRRICDRRGVKLIADAAHSLGGSFHDRKVGTLADFTTLSFHPVKHITTAEGGMVLALDAGARSALRTFRNHGITTDHREREERKLWFYEMRELGFNYRLSDLQCALGLSQLKKLPAWLTRRREIAARYDEAFRATPGITPLKSHGDRFNVYHLYVIRVAKGGGSNRRDALYAKLRDRGIGANVHYIPVHLHPYYKEQLGTGLGLCPVAESAYEEILSLPMFPTLTHEQISAVIDAVTG